MDRLKSFDISSVPSMSYYKLSMLLQRVVWMLLQQQQQQPLHQPINPNNSMAMDLLYPYWNWCHRLHAMLYGPQVVSLDLRIPVRYSNSCRLCFRTNRILTRLDARLLLNLAMMNLLDPNENMRYVPVVDYYHVNRR